MKNVTESMDRINSLKIDRIFRLKIDRIFRLQVDSNYKLYRAHKKSHPSMTTFATTAFLAYLLFVKIDSYNE